MGDCGFRVSGASSHPLEILLIEDNAGEYADAPRPDLILLDLNLDLPRLDGREVLRSIKNDVALKQIPVIVLTSSRTERDLLGAYDQHANCSIDKPVEFDQFIEVIRSIEDFWLTVVVLPPRE